MSDAKDSSETAGGLNREEMLSAIFANMVIQQANTAMIFLGHTPHPQTGQHVKDLDAAGMFIDQLEMLEAKTKGNLDKREEALLKQSLMTLRMAFVEAVEKEDATAAPSPTLASASPTPPDAEEQPKPEAAATAAEADSRKKFTKKY